MSFRFISVLCSQFRLSICDRVIFVEIQADAVHAVPLVGRCAVSLALEDVSKMATTVAANNLRPRHAKRTIRVPRHRARDVVKIRWPSAAGLELVVGFVKWRVAAGTGVDAFVWVMLVVLSGTRRFRALLTQNTKLF